MFRINNSVYSSSGLVYSTSGPVVYSSSNNILRRSVIVVTIIAIFYIFANCLERRKIIVRILGANNTVGVGADNSNGLARSNIFYDLPPRFITGLEYYLVPSVGTNRYHMPSWPAAPFTALQTHNWSCTVRCTTT